MVVASPGGKRQPGRRLRSQAHLATDDWKPAADFSFGSPSPKRSVNKALSKMKSPNNRKLRRQTMMPPRRGGGGAPPITIKTLTTSPLPLSQRRTRRQSMMPIKLRESVITPTSPKKQSLSPPSSPPAPAAAAAKSRSKRRLGPDMETVEKPTVNKKSRVIPASKSSIEVKTAATASSPPPTRKHKSLTALPKPSRNTTTTTTTTKTQAAPPTKPATTTTKPQPAEKPTQTTRKRALSPASPKGPSSSSHPDPDLPSPPKRRAATRSHSESQFKRTKSLPRGQKRSTKVPDKQPLTPPPQQKAASPVRPAAKTPRVQSTPALKTPSLPLTPRSERVSTPKAVVEIELFTPPKTPQTDKKEEAKAKPKTPSKTPRTSKRASKTPKASKSKPVTPSKTPKTDKRATKTPKTDKRKPVTPSKTPKTDKKGRKTPKKETKKKSTATPKSPPSHKAESPAKASPKQTKSAPRNNNNKIRSPKVVISKIKSPPTRNTTKVLTPANPSPRRNRLTRSAAKTSILSTSKSTKHVQLKVEGKSPSPSIATFRKTPSSRKTTSHLDIKDLGASPILPSAHLQLQRIRDDQAKKLRSTPPPSPRKTPSRTTTTNTTTSSPTKLVTKADIHASGNGKCGLTSSLDNHLDTWQSSSTPTPRSPLPSTPKSSRRPATTISRFTRVTSSKVTLQGHSGAPKSSTPIKGSDKLEVLGGRSSIRARKAREDELTRQEDTVDGGDSSVEEESVDLGGETSLEVSVEGEETEEEEDSKVDVDSTTTSASQSSRKSYCSLM